MFARSIQKQLMYLHYRETNWLWDLKIVQLMLMIGLRSFSIYKMLLLILISNKQCQANRKRKELVLDRKKN